MARAIANSPGSVATVGYGRNVDRLESFCEQYKIPAAMTSLEDAVRSDDVDAVYVGLPNHVHHEAVALAAAAGKAVLSEKSLTVSVEQTEVLLNAVRGNVFFVEGLMYLSHPIFAKFCEVLADGRLGYLKLVNASYAADIAHLVNPEGQGAIYNLGCYPASLMQLVVDTLCGDGAFSEGEFSVNGIVSDGDGNVCEAAATLHFASGALGLLHTAETYGMAHQFSVQGSKGVLTFLSNPWLPAAFGNLFEWRGYDGSSERFSVDTGLDAFDHQVRLVEACVSSGRLEAERPSPRLQDSEALMNFLTVWELTILNDLALGA